MKRVLVITYYWPPAGGSGVQRWVKFAKYLPSFGWQPVIYTPENPQYQSIDKTLADDIPPGTEVIRRKITEPYGIYRALTRGKGSTDMKTLTSQDASQSASQSRKSRISLFLRSNLFIPDPRVWWVRPSVRYLKGYLKEHPVDVIVTTGPPHSLHLIGRKLSKKTGIPWVSDFRDPWTKMYWFKKMLLTGRSVRRHEKLEKAVLDDSTVVLAVTPLVQEDFRKMTETPVEMITNGYDGEDFNQVVESDGHFNIVHTGLFPVDGNPQVLWDCLKKLCETDPDFRKELRIRLVGQTDEFILKQIEAAGLSENTVNLGYCNHKEAVREQMASSMLILPLRNDPEYSMILPGKLFEYLASGRAVLGFGDPEGAMARVLDDTGAGKVCSWDDAAATEEFLLMCWKAWREGEEPVSPRDTKKYSRKALAASLAALLERISSKEPKEI